jgi:hypothetical protein
MVHPRSPYVMSSAKKQSPTISGSWACRGGRLSVFRSLTKSQPGPPAHPGSGVRTTRIDMAGIHDEGGSVSVCSFFNKFKQSILQITAGHRKNYVTGAVRISICCLWHPVVTAEVQGCGLVGTRYATLPKVSCSRRRLALPLAVGVRLSVKASRPV